MPSEPSPPDLQQLALHSFTALSMLRPAWGGAIVLSVGLDVRGAALSIAVNIAGGVSLAIEDDPARLREVVRSGAVDFVVNTLDEAIRAMKNEVRKQAPLSVALDAQPAVALAEILERGLAPQAFAVFGASDDEHVQNASVRLAAMGADLIDFRAGRNPSEGYQSAQVLIASQIERYGWTMESFQFGSAAELHAFDAWALSTLAPDDHLRRRWLEAAPRILQRQRPPRRALWITDDEKRDLPKVEI